MTIVRNIASIYDEQFRLGLSHNPSASWAEIDSELWLIYMYGSVATAGNQSQVANKQLRCYSFNYNGQCFRQGYM
jgi:hypothetical protein